MTDIVATFDYDSLSPEAADIARHAANRIRSRIVGGYLATGHDLLEIKAHLGHGKFCAWLASEFGMTIRTAGRYMAAARFEMANLDIMSKLLPETIQALASPSLSDGIRAACIERVEAGQILLPKDVKEMAAEVRHVRRQQDSIDKRKRLSRAGRQAERDLLQAREARALRRDKQGEEDKARFVALCTEVLGDRQHEALELLRRLRTYDVGRLLEDGLAAVASREPAP